MDERRRHFRYPISLAGEILHGEQEYAAEASDLSLGGVGFIMSAPLMVGTEVDLNMFLLEDGIEDERTPPFSARAVVSWAAENKPSGFKIGIRFLSIEPKMEELLRGFIQRLSQ